MGEHLLGPQGGATASEDRQDVRRHVVADQADQSAAFRLVGEESLDLGVAPVDLYAVGAQFGAGAAPQRVVAVHGDHLGGGRQPTVHRASQVAGQLRQV